MSKLATTLRTVLAEHHDCVVDDIDVGTLRFRCGASMPWDTTARGIAEAREQHKAEALAAAVTGSAPTTPTQDEMAEGHLFEISMRCWGVSRVVNDPTYGQDDWTLPPLPVHVRAWSLPQALEKAAALPLHVWFPADEED